MEFIIAYLINNPKSRNSYVTSLLTVATGLVIFIDVMLIVKSPMM